MCQYTKKLEALLPLTRKVIGVKFARTQEEYDFYTARSAKGPISYCSAVKCAACGHAIKFEAKHSSCPGSSRALGLKAVTGEFLSGQTGMNLGLYESMECASCVAAKMPCLPFGMWGIIVKPLEEFESAPDVVLVITNSRCTMRFIQGYTYFYGANDHFFMTGNQAMCVEATVIPYQNDRMNISMLCSGTRHKAQWNDDEIVIGLPFSRFEKTVEGIRKTANAVEPDARKKVIIEELQKLGDPASDIFMGGAYYLHLQQKTAAERAGVTRESFK